MLVFELCQAYYNLFVGQTFKKFLDSKFDEDSEDEKAVFQNMCLIYLQEVILLDGQFFSEYLSKDTFDDLKFSVMKLCK